MKALAFDDISLIPQYSEVASRHDVDLSCELGPYKLKLPILSANMKTVTGTEMCAAMYDNGGIGVLHRFGKIRDSLDQLYTSGIPYIASVGVDNDIPMLATLKDRDVKVICIDVAHGHHSKVRHLIQYIRYHYEDSFTIIAGNVCTGDAAFSLAKWGADIIKVGVGPGSHCTTRVVTGHGVPQVTAIKEVHDGLFVAVNRGFLKKAPKIIADGGIRNSGDIAKALAVGADYVMIGRLLAGCQEAPSEAIMRPDGLKKVYRGSASYEAQVEYRDKRTVIAEGVQSEIPYVGTVEQVLTKLANGLKSACSYSGAHNLKEFKDNARYVEVTGASHIEGTPHGA